MFIAAEKSSFYKSIKNNLKSDQCLVICDFAENYAFIIENAITGFHWNNDQATLFPIVFYYLENGSIRHKTLVFISDCKKHDSVAVYVFLKAFNEFLSDFHVDIRECMYFSNGAPQQFKNVKHFTTIYYHQADFGRSAQWHFHAAAYGKGPCDGAGGALKRKTRKASLQMTSDKQIASVAELYEWVIQDECFSNISVFLKTENDYNTAAEFLKYRFAKCKTIAGTQKFHSVEPAENYEVKVRSYSKCSKL